MAAWLGIFVQVNRGAFAAITNDNNQILLVRSLTHGKLVSHWSLPGGVVEENETLENGAMREVLEETGVYCEIGRLLVTVENIESEILIHIFKATYVHGDLKVQADEIVEAGWFSIAHAHTLPLAFNTKEVLTSL